MQSVRALALHAEKWMYESQVVKRGCDSSTAKHSEISVSVSEMTNINLTDVLCHEKIMNDQKSNTYLVTVYLSEWVYFFLHSIEIKPRPNIQSP